MSKNILDNLAQVPLESLKLGIDATAHTVEEATSDFYDVAGDWIKAAGQRHDDAFAALEILTVQYVLLPPNRVVRDDRTKLFYNELTKFIDQDRELGSDEGDDDGDKDGDKSGDKGDGQNDVQTDVL